LFHKNVNFYYQRTQEFVDLIHSSLVTSGGRTNAILATAIAIARLSIASSFAEDLSRLFLFVFIVTTVPLAGIHVLLVTLSDVFRHRLLLWPTIIKK
jgi:hypothetical protein